MRVRARARTCACVCSCVLTSDCVYLRYLAFAYVCLRLLKCAWVFCMYLHVLTCAYVCLRVHAYAPVRSSSVGHASTGLKVPCLCSKQSNDDFK